MNVDKFIVIKNYSTSNFPYPQISYPTKRMVE